VRRCTPEIDDAAEAERAQCGDGQSDLARDVRDGVAATIAVPISIGQLADADTVKDDDNGPAGDGRPGQTRQPSCVE
jgi:hypothetical protein